jgi:hypothetical protein
MHYYTRDGESRHEVMGANGKIRPTTIADARKLGLVPSVTTVMDVQSKPALINWIQDQLIQAAILKPFHPHEWEEDEYKSYLIGESKRVGREAADKGNEVHNLLDQWFSIGQSDDVYVPNVVESLNSKFGNDIKWISEEGFTSRLGYGGRVDLHSKSHNIIVDFKTKNKEDINSIKAYDDHKMQLAAYQVGLCLPKTSKRYNCFISTAKGFEGQCNIVECKEFDKPWDVFEALLNYWRVKNNYDPRIIFDTGA